MMAPDIKVVSLWNIQHLSDHAPDLWMTRCDEEEEWMIDMEP